MAASLPGMFLAGRAPRAIAADPPRSLAFYHTHTDERCSVLYYDDGRYLDDALLEVSRFLRDFRTGDVHPIDRELLDFLFAVRLATESGNRFQVISGYRSPVTNARLRKASNGVAKKSLHMQGRAIDVRLGGVETAYLRKAALALERGGVGYYAKSDFVHLDTGRPRSW